MVWRGALPPVEVTVCAVFVVVFEAWRGDRMSSDNPFEQVAALIARDERQQLPEPVDAILKTMAKVPGAGPFVALVRYESEKQRFENAELMLRTAWDELKRVSATLDDFLKDPARHDAVKRLVLDATRKAEGLRDRKRVERIGKILAHALTLSISDFDKAEEMMRIARDLSDADVLGLRHLYDTQSETLQRHGLNFELNEINRIWRDNLSKNRIAGVLQPEWRSIFLKLQGLGLATAVERIPTELPLDEQPFALLAKGADFVRYIEGAVGNASTASAA